MYSDDQIEELKIYEQSIRNEAIKTLCNGKQVTKMRMIIRNLLDHVDACADLSEAEPGPVANEELPF